jgi:DNA replicative helicase MCM subunit Mcm2 (Cdc46/Mcm family)
MNYDDQAGFLDAMQEGKIRFGFNMTLDGSATFIISANPTNNSTWQNAEKIDLDEVPLISPLRDRFDLFFVFRTAYLAESLGERLRQCVLLSYLYVTLT